MPADFHPKREVPANLTESEARQRSRQVRDIDYILELDLEERSTSYQGRLVMDFVLAEAGKDLALDFQGERVERLVLNRRTLPRSTHRRNRVMLPARLLVKGRNTLEVDYENDFDNDGAGFHKSIDPADQREYFYGQFEPFDANRVFPCLDQPDLKATYELTIRAPRHWQVVANAPEVSCVDEDGRRVHHFARTERFATYVFGLVAGEYAVFTDPKARIPARILVPHSLAEHVDAEEIFEVTRQGFDFFEEYFDIPYPFHKYDQIFVPQFNWGAMENVGCICFTDRYMFRHRPTETERERRANTVLHEMAHMWFGDLVTMRWWNDLWLNESFATYMAFVAEVENTRFKGAWHGFFSRVKSWACWQDQLPSTHPIETPVPDTDTTHTNFDGITYGKGASVLKQLVHHIGEPAFKKGVREYLKKYAWKNAERADFLACLGKAAGKDLKRWTKLWLQSSGTNVITPRIDVKGGKVHRFWLEQEGGNGDGVLRPHSLRVATYQAVKSGALELGKVADVLIEKARVRVPELEGLPAPAFVNANHEDHGFAKVRLDETSLEYAREHLSTLSDEFLRSVIWQTVWFMVRDGVCSPRVLPDLFLRHAPYETCDRNVAVAAGYVRAALARYLPDELAGELQEELHDIAWRVLREVPPHTDLQKIWFGVMVPTAHSEGAQQRLERMLTGGEFVRGLELDQDKRWSLVTQLCGTGFERAEGLLDEEEARDRTEKGKPQAHRARVSLADPQQKRAAWDRFVHDLDEPLDLQRAGMSGFWWSCQKDLLKPYATEFFKVVSTVEQGRGSYFMDAFTGHLYPSLVVDEKVLKRGQKVVASRRKLPAYVRRSLVERNDEMERSLRLRELAVQE